MGYVLHIFGAACMLLCLACGTARQISASGDRQLLQALSTSPVFGRHHTGFALYDPQEQRWLCQFNADKYFTPASNTKILTLLTCLHVLPDSVEGLRYLIRGDSLIFRGTGDPSLLYHHMRSTDQVLNLLRDFPGQIYYDPGEEIDRYGKGWAWDDYRYAYQVEKSTLPVYGNRLRVHRDATGELHVVPRYFAEYVLEDTTIQRVYDRDPVSNTFTINPQRMLPGDTISIPFNISDYEIARLLSDTLKKAVTLLYDAQWTGEQRSIFSTARDTLLKRMIQESDNFIAEQLLMQCAKYMRGVHETDSAIQVARRMILQNSPDVLYWVDGSGLSRYNLVTPRSLIRALEQVSLMVPREKVKEIFPAGGKSGTIASWYHADPPFVYAKTGTLRNQHCLSGYVITEKGRWLIFSFMHNHFTQHSNAVKEEMDRMLREIKRRY